MNPELTREIHNSNLIIHMDARIKEVMDYMEMFKFEGEAEEMRKTVIEKLDSI